MDYLIFQANFYNHILIYKKYHNDLKITLINYFQKLIVRNLYYSYAAKATNYLLENHQNNHIKYKVNVFLYELILNLELNYLYLNYQFLQRDNVSINSKYRTNNYIYYF